MDTLLMRLEPMGAAAAEKLEKPELFLMLPPPKPPSPPLRLPPPKLPEDEDLYVTLMMAVAEG